MPESKGKRERWLIWLIGLGLAGGTLACYWPARHFAFVNFDDPLYVYQAPMVRRGLSWPGVAWAFHSVQGGNWNPLIWLSHMADCQVFGLEAGGHHFTNIVLHAANVLLLFLILRGITGALWRSALVAAIFAWHPLHVESVAWVSERKDVLSTLFWLLTLWAYARYAKTSQTTSSRRATFYGLALILFVLGLMCKPMLVTLPVVFLLLDYWPLQRKESLIKLLAEKIPFAVLSLAAGLITIWAQQKGESVGAQALPLRLENAADSYLTYSVQMFWPARLAVFYPFPSSIPLWRAAGATLALGAITYVVLRTVKDRRYLATGWFWFVVTLLPVIGILQVGMQARADRYTYIPYIGLALMLSWGLADLVQRWPTARGAVIVLVVSGLGGCGYLTRLQLQHWENSTALYTHALNVTSGNYIAHSNLGYVLIDEGKPEEAEQEFREVVRLTPGMGKPYNDLGKAFALQNKMDDALLMFSNAVWLDPKLALARRNLGQARVLRGEVAEGLAEMEAGVRGSPDDIEVQAKFAGLLIKYGRAADALPYCEVVARAQPQDAQAQYNLGVACLARDRFQDAARSLTAAVRLAPEDPQSMNALAWIYCTSPQSELRNGPEAVRLAEKACALTQRQEAPFLNTLAAAYADTGRFEDAITTAQLTLDLAEAANNARMAAVVRRQLELYKSGKPFRDEP